MLPFEGRLLAWFTNNVTILINYGIAYSKIDDIANMEA